MVQLGWSQIPVFQNQKGTTMKYRCFIGAFAVTALATALSVAGDGLKSGPQVGAGITTPFHPTNLTGLMAGKKHCLV
jgi:hypothetical protein